MATFCCSRWTHTTPVSPLTFDTTQRPCSPPHATSTPSGNELDAASTGHAGVQRAGRGLASTETMYQASWTDLKSLDQVSGSVSVALPSRTSKATAFFPRLLTLYIRASAARNATSQVAGGVGMPRNRCCRSPRIPRARAPRKARPSPSREGSLLRSDRRPPSDAELISAQRGDHVGAANGVRQCAGDKLEDPVAFVVAAFVVDLLEIVQIDAHRRSGLATAWSSHG